MRKPDFVQMVPGWYQNCYFDIIWRSKDGLSGFIIHINWKPTEVVVVCESLGYRADYDPVLEATDSYPVMENVTCANLEELVRGYA